MISFVLSFYKFNDREIINLKLIYKCLVIFHLKGSHTKMDRIKSPRVKMEYWKVQQVLAKRFVCYVQHLRGGNPLLQTCSYRAKYASVIQEQIGRAHV